MEKPTPDGQSLVSEPDDNEVEDTYGETALESLFSRVLSRGFRTVNARQNISKDRCEAAMKASRGPTSETF